MEACSSKWKVLSYLLISICLVLLSSVKADAAVTTYTLRINSAASIVHTSGGFSGGGMGDLSVSGTFQAVVTDGMIQFHNIDVTVNPIVPNYPGTATQTSNGYSFSGSKVYSNSTGGGNFSGAIGNTGFSMSGNFNAPCCDQYNYQFVLSGIVVSVAASGVDTISNNFTMIAPDGSLTGGTNDVVFTWDGTMKTSVAVSGQTSNATLSSVTPFFGVNWTAHDVAVYGPGTYTVYADCPAGSPGCGAGAPITFTIASGQLGVHTLFDWGGNNDIDVVDIWMPKAVFGPSPLYTGPDGGSADPAQVWDWMSSDWDGDGINGSPLVDGPFVGFNANFNVMGETAVPPLCVGKVCNDNNACTIDTCDPATGNCVFTPRICNDSNACTADSCNPATGCVYTPIVLCNDNNACTNDTCDPVSGNCVFTPISCNDNNACTYDSCYPATGCVHTAVNVSDGDPCTIDSCNPVTGAVFTPKNCDDNNPCTTDTCDRTTGNCVHTPVGTTCIGTTNNNFTMLDPVNQLVGGTNDVQFSWDGTTKTSVAASGQVSNATLSSTCPFFGMTWSAHDVAIYGPGTYTVYTACPAGSPGCGTTSSPPITFTVGAGELGVHVLFNWGISNDIDVVNVWAPNAVFAPSSLWTGTCGANPADKVWNLMSKDVDGDGINGYPLVDGPFVGFNTNFNVMAEIIVPPLCVGKVCNDNNACTIDTCDPATGNCVFTPLICNDSNACTADSCNPATGCVYTPIVLCNDNNACTTDTCDPVTGNCVFAPINCDDHNACTTDTCNPATGCVHTLLVCNDNNPCTTDRCNLATGKCVFTLISCDDGNPCTVDTCDSASGTCVHTPVGTTCIGTTNNNFTMLDPVNEVVGGTNDVQFSWDGTMKTSVAASGQVSNATLSSTCPFAGMTWSTHDVTIYGPGTYTVYTACPAGSPGCGITSSPPITFTVGAGEIGVHMLFNWGINNDIDVVNVWAPKAIFAPSPLWTGACGSNSATKVWDLMSKDVDGDGINGLPMVDGPFVGFGANFNVMGQQPCTGPCDDNNACTIDTYGANCVCVHTPINCNDNNACTTDTCNPATGCVHTPIICNDNNACTDDACLPATGCVFYPKSCNDNNACTADSCDPVIGCVYTPINCNDNNACTIDSCNPATGCVYTPRICNDNNLCTTDTCNPATGCVFTPLPIVSDNNPCTNDSCDPATGLPVYTPNTAPCDDGLFCNGTDTCSGGTCSVHSGNSCPSGTFCDEATDQCICQKSVTTSGGGQKPNGVDLQIQTEFTVSNDGCFIADTKSCLTFSVGSIISVNYNKGTGPNPTSATWNGGSIPMNGIPFTITCSAAGPAGTLVLTNKDALGGRDTDRINICCE